MTIIKESVYQWDKGVFLEFGENEEINQVHFSFIKFGKSKDVDIIDGICEIPPDLLRTSGSLYAWGVIKTSNSLLTEFVEEINVIPRARPADYVYTPEELKQWEDLQKQIGELDELNTEEKDSIVKAINELAELGGSGASVEEIEKIINEYLQKNPPKIEESDPLAVKSINGKKPDESGNVVLDIPTVEDILSELPVWEGGEY